MSKQFICLFLVCFLYTISAQEYRSIDGYMNNKSNPEWGQSMSLLKRVCPADYVDGIEIPKLTEATNRPNPRMISNVLFAQTDLINSKRNLSDYTWVFGQFIDHDLSFTFDDSDEPLSNIVVPNDDAFFQPGEVIPMFRSAKAEGSGTSVDNPRNYVNEITSYLDGSNIYGSSTERANWLRSKKDGKLKVSEGNLLPWNTVDGEFNSDLDYSAPFMDDPSRSLIRYFVAGDKRANENPLLLSFHTIFVREHNRLCDKLLKEHPFWADEKLYQEARRLNVAFLQKIAFEEWLPAMGVKLPAYNGYKPSSRVQIFNEFSAAAFRFGHTLINSNIVRMESDGETISRGNISLKDAFFNPFVLILSGGVEPFVKGMASQVQQELDCKVVDDVRNFLFAEPGTPGLDLAAININRGRDRGIPSYNSVREFFGLPKIPSFYELTKNHDEAELLAQVYGSIDHLDAWVGMLAETHMEDAMMGRLMQVIMKEQFQLLRDGDRFYYKNDPSFTAEELAEINGVKLQDIIMRNTEINIMQDEVFLAMPHEEIPTTPKPIAVDFDATIYPNLVEDHFNLNVFSSLNTEATVEIINMNGSVVKRSKAILNEGQNALVVPDLSRLPHGMYNVLIYNQNSYNILRFIKG